MNTKTELIKLDEKFKPAPYKFIINAFYTVYKHDRNGNTYHRVSIRDQQGNEIADSHKTYGYGNQFEVTAKRMIVACIQLPRKYNTSENRMHLHDMFYEMEQDKFLKINFKLTSL